MITADINIVSRRKMPMSPEFQFRYLDVKTVQDVLILTVLEPNLRGDQVAEEIYLEMLAAVDRTGLHKIVLDLGNALLFSSVAFRPLLGLRRKLKELGGHLVLCNLSHALTEIFRTTRLITSHGSSPPPFEACPGRGFRYRCPQCCPIYTLIFSAAGNLHFSCFHLL